MTNLQHFSNPNFALLADNQYREQNERLITELLCRFQTGEPVWYVEGENYAFGHRADYYDLVGIYSDERGWEVIPVPVFGRAFGFPENVSVRERLQPLCAESVSRDNWDTNQTEWALAHEVYTRPIDEQFRSELERGWLTATSTRAHFQRDGAHVVSDEVNEVVYPASGGFELYGPERCALSRYNSQLYNKLGGVSY